MQNTRRSLLRSLAGAAGLAAAPAEATTPSAAAPITQAELSRLFALDAAIDHELLALGYRLQAGAAVEQGPLTVEVDWPETGPHPIFLKSCVGFYRVGVDITRHE